MYPDLSYILHDLIGTPRDSGVALVKTFGIFLLLAFLVASQLLRSELKRRERIGQLLPRVETVYAGGKVTVLDYVFNTFLGFVLGFKLSWIVTNFSTFLSDPLGNTLSTTGYAWGGILGAVALCGYYVYVARTQGQAGAGVQAEVFPSDRIGPITMIAAVGGLVGAKFFAIIEYLPRFFEDPIGMLLSGSGLAIYGGLIGGFLAVFWYMRSNDIPAVPVMDAVAPALIVAYGVGRMGCQFSGDGDWGTVAAAMPEGWFLPDWLWAQTYPHNVSLEGVPIPGCEGIYCRELAEGHYPTPIYEITMAFAIGAILWLLRTRLTYLPGMLFCLYLFFNGVERFFIEFVRVNDQYDVLGVSLTQAQMIAIGFMSTGLAGGSWIWKRRD